MRFTSTRQRVLAATVVTAGAALLATTLDEPHAPPRPLTMTVGFSEFDRRPEIARAAVPGPTARPRAASASALMPAPAGETRPRTIATGRRAHGMCEAAVTVAFESQVGAKVTFSPCGDRDAVELLMLRRADVALIGGALSTRELQAGLRETTVGVELFALAVAADFPLQSVARAQMRQILTGEVTDWQMLGCDRGAIVVVAPADRDLATRAATALIPGDDFTSTAVRVADGRHVADQLLRNAGGIAVVRVTSTPPQGMKLLQIDWTPPAADTFRYGSYPYGTPLQVVSVGAHGPLARAFLVFAASDDGRELLGRTLLLP